MLKVQIPVISVGTYLFGLQAVSVNIMDIKIEEII